MINQVSHCVRSVRIRSYSGPYSVRIRENTDQNNSEYRHISHSVNFTSFSSLPEKFSYSEVFSVSKYFCESMKVKS